MMPVCWSEDLRVANWSEVPHKDQSHLIWVSCWWILRSLLKPFDSSVRQHWPEKRAELKQTGPDWCPPPWPSPAGSSWQGGPADLRCSCRSQSLLTKVKVKTSHSLTLSNSLFFFLVFSKLSHWWKQNRISSSGKGRAVVSKIGCWWKSCSLSPSQTLYRGFYAFTETKDKGQMWRSERMFQTQPGHTTAGSKWRASPKCLPPIHWSIFQSRSVPSM